jgi:S-DNA-T family DNA segregation ATPase FtsK/SpoIIIE
MRASTFSPIDYVPDSVREFAGRRIREVIGATLLGAVFALALALVTWSVQDPSLNNASDGAVRNLLGPYGAIVADLFMQSFGIAVVAPLAPLALWGWRLMTLRRFERPALRVLLLIGGSLAAAGVASLLPVTDRWPLPTGLGGMFGDAVLALPRRATGGHAASMLVIALVLAGCAILALTAAAGFGLHEEAEAYREPEPIRKPAPQRRSAEETDVDGEPGVGLVSLGAIIHAALSVKGALTRAFRRSKPAVAERAPWLRRETEFDEPSEAQTERREPSFGPPPFEPTAYAPPTRREAAAAPGAAQPAAIPRERETETAPSVSGRIAAPAPAIKSGKRARAETQPSILDRLDHPAYQMPGLLLLAEAKKQQTKISEDALEQNARLLEGVLDDFGVKGEIFKVHPGPVVTLYELEPAPGIKSSRVIGLADDIARSMSAISARVAVVQGRNAIGIELPNQKRETVYLRELLSSQDFEKSKHKLAIALGKTIGGEPVIVDLARMPHLLVAGTTGSGKSVAINTMILSLLYRMKPEECRLIMVDPKMLELSVYDGIPHLLTPVVTDPKKAVVALKWAVREMEDRYKKMSKVGVRNIDGFNARVGEACAKGEVITRTVQTGFDRETGEAIYEQEEMDLAPLPYIVVIVDEMADLMMVAGKDIEGAIQRLAQMARAAGIHLIMATQRPSVDVITGTIKANFPTRISFQVTSKIDSRTILGEQGAEQLLGQGDMLYMAGGGRISRVHGPFVSDNEVEKVVAHLKTQGQPDYLDAITAEDDPEGDDAPAPGSMDAEESGDLYDRAVNIVLRDRKCSTSYIQRRLSVGYNKAASLVERMEKEGVVGPANHAGKREILVGGGVDRGAFDAGADD